MPVVWARAFLAEHGRQLVRFLRCFLSWVRQSKHDMDTLLSTRPTVDPRPLWQTSSTGYAASVTACSPFIVGEAAGNRYSSMMRMIKARNRDAGFEAQANTRVCGDEAGEAREQPTVGQ